MKPFHANKFDSNTYNYSHILLLYNTLKNVLALFLFLFVFMIYISSAILLRIPCSIICKRYIKQ